MFICLHFYKLYIVYRKSPLCGRVEINFVKADKINYIQSPKSRQLQRHV